jgi:hypothetical protein
MRLCPQRPRRYHQRLRIRCRMRRSCRRIRPCRHRRPDRPGCGQTTPRASRRYRCPARRRPTTRPPPHQRPSQTSLPRPDLSGTEADRSDTAHNPSPAGADATSAAAARLSTREVSATGCNACRRRDDFVTPPVPGRPERSRAESGACLHAINGATARRSRHPDSRQANLAEPHRRPASLSASVVSREQRC